MDENSLDAAMEALREPVQRVLCPACDGTGASRLRDSYCWFCKGRGQVESEIALKLLKASIQPREVRH